MYISLLKLYNRVYPYVNDLRGSYRLRQILKQKAEDGFGDIVEFELMSTRISAPSNTTQALNLYLGDRDFEELEHLKYILHNIEEDETFADVGSSFGLFSSVIAEKTAAEVHSFEPLKLNVAFQELNQALFDYDFSVKRAAVSDEIGEISLKVSDSSHGQNSISPKRSSKNTQMVEQVCLDEELENLDYIKIDVEGAEIEVLRGMEKLLEKCKPVILLELHNSELQREFNSSKEEVLELLEKEGYSVHSAVDRGNNNIILEPK